MRVDYAIVYVSEMSRSVEFYRDVLGLALKFETPHWTDLRPRVRRWLSTRARLALRPRAETMPKSWSPANADRV